jgi:outer membrane protein, heavy metal efflux system
MQQFKRSALAALSLLIASWVLLGARLIAVGQSGMQQAPAVAPLQLPELEERAIRNNPTVPQAEAAVRAAEGRRRQARLWPNPIVGYEAEGLAFNPLVYPFRNGQYFFVEQQITLFGKLRRSGDVFIQERAQAEASATAQQLRVRNAVRMLYYEALGAQQLVELRRQLAALTREAVKISAELFNVGQADRPDVLAAEVEAQRAELDVMRAENEQRRVWLLLASVINDPSLKPTLLAGSLEDAAPQLNQDELLATVLRESPEVRQAQAGVARARAVLARARIEPRPDVFVRGGIGYSNEFAEFFGGKTGWEGRVEAGVRVPLFNRNQGSVAAARAELQAAEREQQRIELTLRTRLAESFTDYLNALGVAARYRREILPRAQQAYDLYLIRFRQMAAAYPQVLIAQRTLFQARTEYVAALVELWQNVAQLRGLLLTGGLDAPLQPNSGGTNESGN